MDKHVGRPRPPFPYVDGTPAALGLRDGLLVLLACAVAFAALVWLPRWMPGLPGSWAGALAFVGLQLAGLRVAVGPAWRALFRRPRMRDLLIALACVPLAFALPAVVALGVVGNANLSANAIIQKPARWRTCERVRRVRPVWIGTGAVIADTNAPSTARD